MLVLTVALPHDAVPTSPSGPRLGVTEKFTSLVSTTLAGTSGVMTCDSQAHPIPRYRYALAVSMGSRHRQQTPVIVV